MIRNTLLPQRVRAQAQLELSQMHAYTRSTQFKNRCIMGGKGRGIMSDFRMGRVSLHEAIEALRSAPDTACARLDAAQLFYFESDILLTLTRRSTNSV